MLGFVFAVGYDIHSCWHTAGIRADIWRVVINPMGQLCLFKEQTNSVPNAGKGKELCSR